MKIIRADAMGMCFGVRDALHIAAQIKRPDEVTIHGELVHNPVVNSRLRQAGFQQNAEDRRNSQPPTPLVMITAHGVSNAERARLTKANKALIDTTCPLVRHVHEAALQFRSEGRRVLLIGKPGHVEVQGIVEDLERVNVIADTSDVCSFGGEALGVLSQTTTPPALFEQLVSTIRQRNPSSDIRVRDSICSPTKRRQNAIVDLIGQVDVVVVVGGNNSNNTRRLVQICSDHQTRAFHVQDASEIKPQWFEHVSRVGLTAGTSTLDETIDEVHQALLQLNARCGSVTSNHLREK